MVVVVAAVVEVAGVVVLDSIAGCVAFAVDVEVTVDDAALAVVVVQSSRLAL